MKRISAVGSLLKKIYRFYSGELLKSLEEKGFTDLRPSFLEVLIYICELDHCPSIKEVGAGCGLKKQTMTGHLNELEKRGYLFRKVNPNDRRAQNIHLSEYGEKFKISLLESIQDIEVNFISKIGEVELERTEHILGNIFTKISDNKSASSTL